MKKLLTLLLILTSAAAFAVMHDVRRDSIILSDPCILADSASGMYYMTGTGGRLWKSPEGGLAGPWIQEPEPLTPPNHGHGMIFRDFNGRYLISLHSHRSENGRYIRRLVLFEVDMSGDKIKLGKRID